MEGAPKRPLPNVYDSDQPRNLASAPTIFKQTSKPAAGVAVDRPRLAALAAALGEFGLSGMLLGAVQPISGSVSGDRLAAPRAGPLRAFVFRPLPAPAAVGAVGADSRAEQLVGLRVFDRRAAPAARREGRFLFDDVTRPRSALNGTILVIVLAEDEGMPADQALARADPNVQIVVIPAARRRRAVHQGAGTRDQAAGALIGLRPGAALQA
jgi:hypothetical protein